MELKKLKRIKHFTEAALDLRSWVISEEEVSSCANITTLVEKIIVWHKSQPTYREGDAVYT